MQLTGRTRGAALSLLKFQCRNLGTASQTSIQFKWKKSESLQKKLRMKTRSGGLWKGLRQNRDQGRCSSSFSCARSTIGQAVRWLLLLEEESTRRGTDKQKALVMFSINCSSSFGSAHADTSFSRSSFLALNFYLSNSLLFFCFFSQYRFATAYGTKSLSLRHGDPVQSGLLLDCEIGHAAP